MTVATLSSKNQIVVPKDAREALGLEPGCKIMMVLRGGVLVLRRRPESFTQALSGIAKGRYPADHLERERSGW
jgi:AbrB family looped-hinge helix DNA binding protein